MGTNYYYRFNECEHCNRYDEAHVGKQSGGWSFLFHGYQHKLWNPDYPEWGYDPESPFGCNVMSRDAWRKIFLNVKGKLFTEYKVRVDPILWIDSLVPPDIDQVRKEKEMMGEHYRPDKTDYIDFEGFRVSTRDFS